MILTAETEILEQNLMWNDLGSNPGLRDERMAAIRFNHSSLPNVGHQWLRLFKYSDGAA